MVQPSPTIYCYLTLTQRQEIVGIGWTSGTQRDKKILSFYSSKQLPTYLCVSLLQKCNVSEYRKSLGFGYWEKKYEKHNNEQQE